MQQLLTIFQNINILMLTMLRQMDGIILKKTRSPLLISHLLTMRSGISYSYDNDGPTMCQTKREVINFRQQKKDYTTQEYARLFSRIPLAFEPGTHFLYGAGYDVLAAIIEIVSEMSLGDYLQRYIWGAIGVGKIPCFVSEA